MADASQTDGNAFVPALFSIFMGFFLGLDLQKSFTRYAKRPPGNRAASSLGRIVPTEAKPSELSGEILSLAK
jgi:hypothetical protein